MLDFLRIPAPVAKPVDTSKAYKKTISKGDDKGWTGSIADYIREKPLEVIVDPYSGKYYGEANSDVYKTYFQNQIRGFKQQEAYLNKNGVPQMPRSSGYTEGMAGIAGITPIVRLTPEQKAATLKTYQEGMQTAQKELDKFSNGYEQRTDMFKSFNKYEGNWNRYFEGNYKNPRLAEDAQTKAFRNKNPLTIQGSGAVADNNSTTRRTTGTGIASAGSLNPFGSLDAGLNI
jgi:hypothetical protein